MPSYGSGKSFVEVGEGDWGTGGLGDWGSLSFPLPVHFPWGLPPLCAFTTVKYYSFVSTSCFVLS